MPGKETAMLLKVEEEGNRGVASYSVEGRVNGEPVKQGDERMFASEQEARSWFVGEAELRGLGSVEPEVY
jgi:hypothetical protein